jgi:hypothetical protein
MASFLGKKYKLESSENFDDYMKVLGKYIYLFLIFYLNTNMFYYFKDLNFKKSTIFLVILIFLKFCRNVCT